MQFFYFLLAVLAVFSQRSYASYEHLHGFEGVPVAEHMPFLAAGAPIVAAHAPVVAAAAPVVAAAAPVYPYALNGGFHPSAAVHNHVSSYHREDGHLSDTGMMLPFKSRRRAAKKVARVRKNLHKKN